MATCKDCLHIELCQYNTYQEAHYFGKDEKIYITIKNRCACKFFKPATDVVEVKKVAEIFAEQFGDCPCNFNNIDEWLPYVCDHHNACDCSIKEGWEQFIRHYREREKILCQDM